jgi:S-adenosylmethionine:tRNA ribosyltransferase-isomerase
LFLNPANKPIVVDYLLTNFHLPKSTLIMLIASFLGLEKTLNVYETAIKEKYRFYSYGDGMLII